MLVRKKQGDNCELLMKVTLIGLVSGITGTGIGGLAAFFVKGINRRFLSFILELSAGLMTSVVCLNLFRRHLLTEEKVWPLRECLPECWPCLWWKT